MDLLNHSSENNASDKEDSSETLNVNLSDFEVIDDDNEYHKERLLSHRDNEKKQIDDKIKRNTSRSKNVIEIKENYDKQFKRSRNTDSNALKKSKTFERNVKKYDRVIILRDKNFPEIQFHQHSQVEVCKDLYGLKIHDRTIDQILKLIKQNNFNTQKSTLYIVARSNVKLDESRFDKKKIIKRLRGHEIEPLSRVEIILYPHNIDKNKLKNYLMYFLETKLNSPNSDSTKNIRIYKDLREKINKRLTSPLNKKKSRSSKRKEDKERILKSISDMRRDRSPRRGSIELSDRCKSRDYLSRSRNAEKTNLLSRGGSSKLIDRSLSQNSFSRKRNTPKISFSSQRDSSESKTRNSPHGRKYSEREVIFPRMDSSEFGRRSMSPGRRHSREARIVSPQFRQGSPQLRSRSRTRRRSFSREKNFHEGKHGRSLSGDGAGFEEKVNEALLDLRSIHQRQVQMFLDNPAAHPDYRTEYEHWCQHRAKTLTMFGYDPRQYDYTSEWMAYWPPRMMSLIQVQWENMRNQCITMMKEKRKTINVQSKSNINHMKSSSLTYSPERKRECKIKSLADSVSDIKKRIKQKPLKDSSSNMRKRIKQKQEYSKQIDKYSADRIVSISKEKKISNRQPININISTKNTKKKRSENKRVVKTNEILEKNVEKRKSEEKFKEFSPTEYNRNKKRIKTSDVDLLENPEFIVKSSKNISEYSQIIDKNEIAKIASEENLPENLIFDVKLSKNISQHSQSEDKQNNAKIASDVDILEIPEFEVKLSKNMYLYSQREGKMDSAESSNVVKENNLDMDIAEDLCLQEVGENVISLEYGQDVLIKDNKGSDIIPESEEIVSSTTSEEIPNNSVTRVLKILLQVGEKLGYLFIPVQVLYDRAIQFQKNGRNSIDIFKETDNKLVLNLINEKITNLITSETSTVLQRVIYQSAKSLLQDILKRVDEISLNLTTDTEHIPQKTIDEQVMDNDTFIDGPCERAEATSLNAVNIDRIAEVTIGKKVSEIIMFIKNALSYSGEDNPSDERLMEIYMNVKEKHIQILELEPKIEPIKENTKPLEKTIKERKPLMSPNRQEHIMSLMPSGSYESKSSKSQLPVELEPKIKEVAKQLQKTIKEENPIMSPYRQEDIMCHVSPGSRENRSSKSQLLREDNNHIDGVQLNIQNVKVDVRRRNNRQRSRSSSSSSSSSSRSSSCSSSSTSSSSSISSPEKVEMYKINKKRKIGRKNIKGKAIIRKSKIKKVDSKKGNINEEENKQVESVPSSPQKEYKQLQKRMNKIKSKIDIQNEKYDPFEDICPESEEEKEKVSQVKIKKPVRLILPKQKLQYLKPTLSQFILGEESEDSNNEDQKI